jgi:molecular chaperone Hsp33
VEPEISFSGGSWITRALVDDGAARVLVVEADEVADAVREAHHLGPMATRLAAEATLAALLLAAYVKGDEKLTLQIALERPQARFIGELDPEHRFRARLAPPDLPDSVDPDDLHGLLFAAKHDGRREVYRGITAIDGSSITQALRAHLQDSSQVHGLLATQVELTGGRVSFAAAVLMERLPPHPTQATLTSEAFRARWGDLPDVDLPGLLADIEARSLRGSAVHILDHRPALWGCSCSRDTMLTALAGLNSAELRAMADEDGGAVVDCHFCNTRYTLDEAELRELAARAGSA